jgi:hypothetical protein
MYPQKTLVEYLNAYLLKCFLSDHVPEKLEQFDDQLPVLQLSVMVIEQ